MNVWIYVCMYVYVLRTLQDFIRTYIVHFITQGAVEHTNPFGPIRLHICRVNWPGANLTKTESLFTGTQNWMGASMEWYLDQPIVFFMWVGGRAGQGRGWEGSSRQVNN